MVSGFSEPVQKPSLHCFLFSQKHTLRYGRVAQIVLLDYLDKVVRQAPSRCMFAGDRKSHACRSCYKYDHRQLIILTVNHMYVVHEPVSIVNYTERLYDCRLYDFSSSGSADYRQANCPFTETNKKTKCAYRFQFDISLSQKLYRI